MNDLSNAQEKAAGPAAVQKRATGAPADQATTGSGSRRRWRLLGGVAVLAVVATGVVGLSGALAPGYSIERGAGQGESGTARLAGELVTQIRDLNARLAELENERDAAVRAAAAATAAAQKPVSVTAAAVPVEPAVIAIDEQATEELVATREQLDRTERRLAEINGALAERDALVDVLKERVAALEARRTAAEDRARTAEARSEAAIAQVMEMIAPAAGIAAHPLLDGLVEQSLALHADVTRTRADIESGERAARRAAAEIERLGGNVSALRSQVAELTQRNDALDDDVERLTATLERRTPEDRKRLEARVVELEGRIASLQRVQQDYLLHITERTISTIDEAERTIRMTGLSVELLVERAQAVPVGLGGPFVEASADALASADLLREVSVLDTHMERWERLQHVLRTLPLTAPVDYYHVTSGYGKRKDPFNGKWARHEGMDLAGPYGSTVFATSAGTVVSAGWHPGYGRMVEIDHGMGIQTRFGHLRQIAVAKGDRVGFREKIGTLGSSGRSTGPHVHYEILVDGKPVDPANFLKAGKYVFKG